VLGDVYVAVPKTPKFVLLLVPVAPSLMPIDVVYQFGSIKNLLLEVKVGLLERRVVHQQLGGEIGCLIL
jgi:hypothetical protein